MPKVSTPAKAKTKPTKKRKKKRSQKLTPKKQDEFCQILAETCNVSEAAKAMGICRRYAYNFRDANAKFAEAWDNAIEQGVDVLEREARRRAAEGVEEPVYYKGERIDTVRKYSDLLMIFLLKAHRPGTYRDRVSMEHTGKDGGPLFPELTAQEKQRLSRVISGD